MYDINSLREERHTYAPLFSFLKATSVRIVVGTSLEKQHISEMGRSRVEDSALKDEGSKRLPLCSNDNYSMEHRPFNLRPIFHQYFHLCSHHPHCKSTDLLQYFWNMGLEWAQEFLLEKQPKHQVYKIVSPF